MGVFNFIETFFFISLGVTILLVALLVYHFKQRINSLEQRYDTLFDIVNSVVKQLRNIQMNSMQPPQTYLAENINPALSSYTPTPNYTNIVYSTQNNNTDSNENNFVLNHVHSIRHPFDLGNTMLPSKNIISAIEEELEDDSEEDSESSVESYVDSDASSGEDSDSDDSVVSIPINKNKLVVSDDEDNNEPSIVSDNIKYVNVVHLEQANTSENIESIVLNDIEDITEDEHVNVKKIELPIEEITIDDSVVKPNLREIYKKMNLPTLKITVIEKGLCSDPSKLKKAELLKLLEVE
jgi:hypothetical protein